ncbi:SF0329 family protein, partial [Paenibacillus chitinolyticus]
PIEESIESHDILLNILALVDRRVGKKRILNMSEKMKVKHPIVQYFYELRRSTL